MVTSSPSNFNEDPANNPPRNLSTNERLEEVFSLIRMGNESKEQNHRWKAANIFWQASTILKQLGTAAGEGEQKQPKQGNGHPKEEEQAKILRLYQQQSIEYRQRSRHVLIEELQDLTKNDTFVDITDNNDHEMTASQRLDVFARIFAGQPENRVDVARTQDANDPKLIEEQESSLENRLSQLNSSLPANLKSEAERVRDLNRGLRRLGLSGIDDAGGTGGQQFQRNWVNDVLTHVHNKSESEQVEDIIAQVQDHVALNPNEYHSTDPEEDHVSMSSAASLSSASQDVDDSNEVDAPPPETCREIHAALISAQVHLAELIALFEVDEDGQAAIEFDASHGWNVLSTTRRLLQNSSRQWKK
jgi:hypothetical protein